ncbi:MAG: LON peptidase substrate-binding domain-containing protein [Microscillaceae bacterium]|nr:LON peptidase substrate-binding domain-containing protein [Microscillaceae bacterium]MDW8461295.1 LON peptidase substrate-binding domain-containing protein [Cytophagales bacterium]
MILPFFPLNLVPFPTERLNLHIFETRYKQLIKECLREKKTFGILPFINNSIATIGTEMQLVQIYREYLDGRMDIETRGIRRFKIISFENPLAGKLYAGGSVEFLEDENLSHADLWLTEQLISLVKELYQILQVSIAINAEQATFLSYQLAHRVGLSIEQEYELLGLPTEIERQMYLVEHLKHAIPIVKEIERTKSLIRMNGHFKRFDPLNF